MVDVTEHDAHERELREAEQLLAMQIDDFKGEEIDPEDEPDLYLPLSAAKALHAALTATQADIARLEADNAALRVEVERLRAENYKSFTDGMEAAAQICGSLAEVEYDDAEGFEAATGCEAAIMRVVKQQREEQARAALTERKP